MNNIILLAFSITMIAANAASADNVQKGEATAPSDSKVLIGAYSCGEILSYQYSLILNEDGTYSIDMTGCIGSYGKSSGTWKLSNKDILLIPTKESGKLEGAFTKLEILKYQDDWLLLMPTHREYYNREGIKNDTCFRKTK